MRYSISDVAEEFNITPSTIRWYEKKGLIPPIKRDENGRRYYDEGNLDWFSVVMCMKGTNMSVENIRKFAELNAMGDSTLQERLDMVIRQRDVTVAKIHELEECLKTIEFKIMYFTECINEGTEENMKKKYYASHIHERLNSKKKAAEAAEAEAAAQAGETVEAAEAEAKAAEATVD